MIFFLFFFKQKTAYEMRISDWSSDVCSSDLLGPAIEPPDDLAASLAGEVEHRALCDTLPEPRRIRPDTARQVARDKRLARPRGSDQRSEEHTSELQSLMRNSYAVFCLKKKNKRNRQTI